MVNGADRLEGRKPAARSLASAAAAEDDGNGETRAIAVTARTARLFAAPAVVSARRILASGEADEKTEDSPAPAPVPAPTVAAITIENKNENNQEKEDKKEGEKGDANGNANAGSDVSTTPTPVSTPAPSSTTATPTLAPTPALTSAPAPTPTPDLIIPAPIAAPTISTSTAAVIEPQIQISAPADTSAPPVGSASTQPSSGLAALPEPLSDRDGIVSSEHPVVTPVTGSTGSTDAASTSAPATTLPTGNTVVSEDGSVNKKDEKPEGKKEDENDSKKGNTSADADVGEDANASKDVLTSSTPVPTLTPAPTDEAPTLTPATTPSLNQPPLETSPSVESSAPRAESPSAQPTPVPTPVPASLIEPADGASGVGGGNLGVADGADADKTSLNVTAVPTGNTTVNEDESSNTTANNKDTKKEGEKGDNNDESHDDSKDAQKEDEDEDTNANANGSENPKSDGPTTSTPVPILTPALTPTLTNLSLEEDNGGEDANTNANANGSENANNDAPTTPVPTPALTPAQIDLPLEPSAPADTFAPLVQLPPTQSSSVPAPVPASGDGGMDSENPDVSGFAGGDGQVKTPAAVITIPTGSTVVTDTGVDAKTNTKYEKKENKKEVKKDGKNERKKDDSNDDSKENGKGEESVHSNTNANGSTHTSNGAPARSTPTPALAPTQSPLETIAPVESSAPPDQSPSAQPTPVSVLVPVPAALSEPVSGASDVGSESPVAESEADNAPTAATTPIIGNVHGDEHGHVNTNEKHNEQNHKNDNKKGHAKDNGNTNGNGANNSVPTTTVSTEPQLPTRAPRDVSRPPVESPPPQSSPTAAQPTQSANEHSKDGDNDHSKDNEKDSENASSVAPTTPTTTEPQFEPSAPADMSVAPVGSLPTQPSPVVEHASGNENDHSEKESAKDNENGIANEAANENASNNEPTASATTEPHTDTSTHADASVVTVDVPSLVVARPAQPVMSSVMSELVDSSEKENGKEHEKDNINASNDELTTPAKPDPQVDPSAPVDASVVAVDAPVALSSLVATHPAQPIVSANEPPRTTISEDDSGELVDSHNTQPGQDLTSPEQPVVSVAPLGEAHGGEGESLSSIASSGPDSTNSVAAGRSSNTAVELSSSFDVLPKDQGKLAEGNAAAFSPAMEQPDTKETDEKSAAVPQANSIPVALVESFSTDKATAAKETNASTPTSSSESSTKALSQLGSVQVALSGQKVDLSAPPVSNAKSEDLVSDPRSKTESGQPGDAASITTVRAEKKSEVQVADHAEERNEGRTAEHAEQRNETLPTEHASAIVVDSLDFDANSKSPIITVDKQLQLSESGDQLGSKDPSKPVNLNLTPAGTSTEEPEKYVRGQSIESQLATGSSDNDGTTSNKDLPHVLGGKQRGASKNSSTSASSAHVYESVRYSTSLAAGMSLALLVCFHFVFMDARLSWTSTVWSPNSWEFVLYVQYLQQATSLSALTLLKTPYFLWEFTDTFSWTNFLIQRDETGKSNSSGTRRRLRTIVLDGLVGYSDRIGQDETKIMYHCVVGFVIAVVIVAMAFLATTAIGKWKRMTENRSVARRILGLAVLVWYFSLFPLSLTASFEMAMEAQANLIETWPMSLSVVALFGVCSGGVAYGARVVLHNSEKDLRRSEKFAVWGVLYAYYTHPTRMFFMFGASVQIIMGICIGVFGSNSTLLLVLVAIQLLCLVAVYTIEPFVNRVVLVATYAIGAVKTVNFGLAFAFLQSSEMSTANREIVANVYLGINALVIYVWLIRLLVVFCSCVAVWSDRKQSTSSTQSGMYTKEPPSGVLQVESSICEAPEEHGYRTSISPAESAQMTAMALVPVSSSQTWSREQWERVV